MSSTLELGAYGARCPVAVQRHAAWVRALTKTWFRADVRGLSTLPNGPFLSVGNHSGTSLMPDMFTWASAYCTQKDARPLVIMAHDAVFDQYPKPFARWLGRLGAVRATRENAMRALADGCVVQVYPGGDYDACRPFSRRNELVFANRRGYVKLAQEAKVPIVPVASIGGHEALFVLTDGQRFARLVRLDTRARLKVFPVTLSVPWGFWFGPMPAYLPLPTKIRVRALEPVSAVGREPDDVDREVRARLQRAMGDLAKGRRWILG